MNDLPENELQAYLRNNGVPVKNYIAGAPLRGCTAA
jgi:hypothetical protein